MRETEKIWMNGELVDWADARIHVGAHGLHYGSGVFEGIRAYETDEGLGGLPADRPPASACTTRRACCTWSCRTRSRSCATLVPRADRRQRAARVLPPADRVLRLRRARRLGARQPGRRRDHELAVGRVPRRGGADEGHQREDLELAADRPERDPARRQGDRRLPQLDARRHRGEPRRLRRGDPAHRRGLRRGRLRREHLHRQGRRDLHARPLDLDPARDHARHGHPDRAGPRLHGAREGADPLRPLPRRRGLHDAAPRPR